MPVRKSSRHTNKPIMVVIAVAGLLFVSTLLAAIVWNCVKDMSLATDAIDDERSITSVQGAIRTLKNQLANTIKDNSVWDDAFEATSSKDSAAWALDNWGQLTKDYPLYDTAIVVGVDDEAEIAYHRGGAISDIYKFFDLSLSELIRSGRLADGTSEDIPVAFVKTTVGIALVGAGAIQPYDKTVPFDPAKAKVLLFARHLTRENMMEVGDDFSIAHLSMGENRDLGQLNAPLKNALDEDVGYFRWPSQRPGARSYETVKDQLYFAGGVMAFYLVCICAYGMIALRNAYKQEFEARYKSTHDTLTGLLNRAGLYEILEEELADPLNRGVDVVLLDLDGFKNVNDTWGHATGDELLKLVALRLREAIPAHIDIARLGGDEFAIVQPFGNFGRDKDIGHNVQAVFAHQFIVDERVCDVGCSAGWVTSSPEIRTVEDMLKRADVALYKAKELGKRRTVIYDKSLNQEDDDAAAFENELREAVADGRIEVCFQPIFSTDKREITGVEALARWASETRGAVRPDKFIAIAERTGIIDGLGLHVVEKAIAAAAKWSDLQLFVNISPVQLRNPLFAQQIAALLERLRFPGNRLTIEITEGILINNQKQAAKCFDELRALGVKIALDDFGNGYASVGALRKFAFDKVKLDRSLVANIADDEKCLRLLKGAIEIASALDAQVTAEGIETERHAELVRQVGCHEMQGYLLGRPATAAEIEARFFTTRPEAFVA